MIRTLLNDTPGIPAMLGRAHVEMQSSGGSKRVGLFGTFCDILYIAFITKTPNKSD